MPERVQLSRAKGWRMPDNTVKVDRTTRWGNPYQVWHDTQQGWLVSKGGCHWKVASKPEGLQLAVEKFEADCQQSVGFFGGATWLAPLRGKNLACWCKAGAPCHADVLLRLANEGQQP